MNWEMIGAVGEVGGAIAVVVTLVYLARQVREGSKQTKINTSITLAAIAQDGFAPIYNHPEYVYLWQQGLEDVTKLTDAELKIFCMFFDRQLFNFETAITAYEEGAYDAKLFESWLTLWALLINSSGGQLWLERGGFPVTDRAKKYLGVN